MKGFYGPKTVAAKLEVSQPTVLNMIYRGDLAAAKVGRRWWIAHSEVKRLLTPRNWNKEAADAPLARDAE